MNAINMMASTVSLGKNGDKTYSRPGFVDAQTKEVALPPKNAKKQAHWMAKNKIPHDAQVAFGKMR